MRYSVKAAARATGVTESRLRTWERRYGIPRPDRSETGRRQYDDQDIALIRRMATLVGAGMAASDAAEAARTDTSPEATSLPAAAASDHPLVAMLTSAAMRYDEHAFVGTIRESVADLGWAAALESVLLVSLKRIGTAWMEASASVAVEHFASQLVRRELNTGLSELPLPDGDAPPLLMACPEGEEHDLALLSLAYILRAQKQPLVYLGADVPAVDLLGAAAATQAPAICLSATTDSGIASLVRTSRTILNARGPRLFVGGPASAALDLAAGVQLPASLVEAAALIRQRLVD